MRLIIVSGRSGSGKSTALDVLEDNGFYCIDNLPAGLLIELAERARLVRVQLHDLHAREPLGHVRVHVGERVADRVEQAAQAAPHGAAPHHA